MLLYSSKVWITLIIFIIILVGKFFHIFVETFFQSNTSIICAKKSFSNSQNIALKWITEIKQFTQNLIQVLVMWWVLCITLYYLLQAVVCYFIHNVFYLFYYNIQHSLYILLYLQPLVNSKNYWKNYRIIYSSILFFWG